MTERCLFCFSDFGVAPHHNPRRSAGTTFGKLTIPIDHPDRLVNACALCHDALHKKNLFLERFRGGLLFTLDSVAKAENKPDADYLRDREGELVWQNLVAPADMDASMGNVVDIGIKAIGMWQPIIPYMNAEQITFAFQSLQEIGSQHVWKQRALMEHQAIRVCFGWHTDEKQVLCPDCGRQKPYGKPYNHRDRVAAVARQFGVSPRTVDYDLAAAPALEEGYQGPRSGAVETAATVAAEPCPSYEDGKHRFECACGKIR